jgi:hypothetical protein
LKYPPLNAVLVISHGKNFKHRVTRRPRSCRELRHHFPDAAARLWSELHQQRLI